MFRVNCRQVGWPGGSRNGSIKAKGSDLSPPPHHIMPHLEGGRGSMCWEANWGPGWGPTHPLHHQPQLQQINAQREDWGLTLCWGEMSSKSSCPKSHVPPEVQPVDEDRKWWSERMRKDITRHKATLCQQHLPSISCGGSNIRAIWSWSFLPTKLFVLPQGTGEETRESVWGSRGQSWGHRKALHCHLKCPSVPTTKGPAEVHTLHSTRREAGEAEHHCKDVQVRPELFSSSQISH